jgi:hypothetical protein
LKSAVSIATVCLRAEELLIDVVIEEKTIHQRIVHLSEYLSVLAGERHQTKITDVSFNFQHPLLRAFSSRQIGF